MVIVIKAKTSNFFNPDLKRRRPKWGFYEESKGLHCATRCIALRFENLLTSSRNFYKLKDLSLDGLAM